MIKEALRAISPPLLVNLFRKSTQRHGWFGNYATWKDAMKEATGYDSEAIAEKVLASVLQVKKGDALYERDSVLFDRIQYSWPLLAGLLWAAAAAKGKLHVLDFGGSLGSTYIQNRGFLSALDDLSWGVIEQKEFVEAGKLHMEDTILKFYYDIETCVRETHPNTFVFSCVLQYLESPYDMIRKAAVYEPQTILVDNMPFTNGKERLTVQRVPPQIYRASYPCWILNREQFIDAFRPAYNLVEHFESPLSILLDGNRVPYEGFIFQKAMPS